MVAGPDGRAVVGEIGRVALLEPPIGSVVEPDPVGTVATVSRRGIHLARFRKDWKAIPSSRSPSHAPSLAGSILRRCGSIPGRSNPLADRRAATPFSSPPRCRYRPGRQDGNRRGAQPVPADGDPRPDRRAPAPHSEPRWCRPLVSMVPDHRGDR